MSGVLVTPGAVPEEVGGAALRSTVGNAALRSPLRTRSAAGGSALLPAERARRRSIEAARPLDAREASDCGEEEVDMAFKRPRQRDPARYTMKAVPCDCV